MWNDRELRVCQRWEVMEVKRMGIDLSLRGVDDILNLDCVDGCTITVRVKYQHNRSKASTVE
jgi:hypothetical protein